MPDASRPQNVTELLLSWGEGDTAALDRLVPLVYDDLRRVARGHLRRERPGHSLQATALVHEVFLRLVDGMSLEDFLDNFPSVTREQAVQVLEFLNVTLQKLTSASS